MIKTHNGYVINQVNKTFKSITPIVKWSMTLSKKSKPSFTNMSMMMFNHAILFMGVRVVTR